MPAVGATHPGGALVEDTAVEVAVDGWLHAASQVAAAVLEAVLVDEQEAFEVVREGPVEDRALGMARSDGSGLRRLIDNPRRTHNDPRVGPDGRIVYVRHDAEGIGQLIQANGLDVWLMDPEMPASARRVTRGD